MAKSSTKFQRVKAATLGADDDEEMPNEGQVRRKPDDSEDKFDE